MSPSRAGTTDCVQIPHHVIARRPRRGNLVHELPTAYKLVRTYINCIVCRSVFLHIDWERIILKRKNFRAVPFLEYIR